MKTVLILGAGITRSARPKGPLKTRPPLDADFFDIAHSSNQQLSRNVLTCLSSLLGDYSSVLSKSFETTSTYLYIKALDSSPGSLYQKGFIDLLTLLGRVLSQTTNSLKIGPQSLIYRFLLSELSKPELKRPSNLTIITFNYDLLLERVLEEITIKGHFGVFFFPGCYRMADLTKVRNLREQTPFHMKEFEHNGVALLKLHGSMNWQSKHNSSQPTPSAMFNPNRELHVFNSPMISSSIVYRGSHRKVYMKPVIVPPVSGKRGMMHKKFLGLWREAARALEQANRVVIAGYSCPPQDLEARILLTESLRSHSGKRVYVIDPNPEVAARFIELCGVDHITIYSSLKDWVRDKIQ